MELPEMSGENRANDYGRHRGCNQLTTTGWLKKLGLPLARPVKEQPMALADSGRPHAARMSKQGRFLQSRAGFSLLELSIVLLVIGLMYAATAGISRSLMRSVDLEKTRSIMSDARKAVIAFSMTNHRLPCPATVGTGVENCAAGVAVGTLPWATLLLSGPVFDTAQQGLVYAVYRNANAVLASDADLATLPNRVDLLNEIVGSLNRNDFCRGLQNGAADAPLNTLASTSTATVLPWTGCTAGAFRNQAFVLASGGYEDMSGDGNFFDGENSDGLLFCFDSPLRPGDATYDDLVIGVSFAEIIGEVCG
jgi:prepilin-type N-terminal cleavage/methylation domain-containing protein